MPKKTSLPQKIALILFGLFLTIAILEIGLRIGGFAILSMQEYKNMRSIKQKGEFRIVCLGESTTQGQYSPFLEEILNQRNIGIKFSVIDKGIVGTNTVAILGQLESNLDKYRPDIVVTMMGINDEGSHMPYETASTSKIVLTLRSFKVYKLARLLWLHMITKLKETEFYTQDVDKQKDKLKEEYKELQQPDPNNDAAYIALGRLYRSQGKFTESEETFKKAIELNPNNSSAYAELGKFYRGQGRRAETEEAFKKAIELNPNNSSAYAELGKFYRDQAKFSESEQAFKNAIELNPKNEYVYLELSWLYKDQGRFSEAEQLLKKAIGLNPGNNLIARSLAIMYYEIGNNELSETYAKKADSLGDIYNNPDTINSYCALKRILDKRKIKLVCVQYPVRNIKPLEKIFKEETEGSIIFVDNERIFKDAIRKEGYKKYFIDMFGGDFGHCTKKGNRLLAENIANVILKEYFNINLPNLVLNGIIN